MYLDEMHVNMEITTPPVRIDREKMLAFAKEFDPHPIHCDEEYAHTTRFRTLIAPGVLSFMTVWAKVVEQDLFGLQMIAGKSTKIEWFRPVFAEDMLVSKGRISRITRRNPYAGVVELTLEVYNQKDELVLTNVTETVVRYRHP